MGVEGEGAGDQRVEARLHRLTRRSGEIYARHGAEFRADEDRRAPLGVALHEAAFRRHIFAGPGVSAVKRIESRFSL